ncbi:amino acid adenylation domain-containing protein, partial [Streptomyces sp. NPDC057757]|uniref:non-ribosomal peptide synthetase n=1 Tax=Streptomyces sp. NPDC057757 TaxID=3346241 RepID=UPI0036AD7B7D
MRDARTDVDVDRHSGWTLHGLALAQAEQRPEAIAVRHAGRELTYRELDVQSASLARLLLRRGVGAGELVGVSMAPAAEMVVAVLAVMRAGAAYVAVDPAYPEERIRFILTDSGARTVLVDEAAAWVPALAGLEGLRTDQPVTDPAAPDRTVTDQAVIDRTVTDLDETVPLPEVAPTQLPYLIYTSGSTGRPKGAMNRHGGVAHTMRTLAEALGLDHTDRVLQVSSLNFDLSVIEIFATFAVGGTVVIPSVADRTDPGALLDLLAAESVTVWSSAPALLRPVTDTARRRGDGLPATLRTVVLAGDRFPPAMVATLAELGPAVRAHNVAGMTEVSCCSTVFAVRKEDAERDAIPWGRTLPGHTAYVLDEQGRTVRDGERGELYIGGVGVGQGYWQRPELTGERFLPDPFAADGSRMYRTGDTVRRRSDGALDFLGRADHQVKIRGRRVETGEIEAVLRTLTPVTDAAVTVLPDPSGSPRLIGYLTGPDVRPNQVRAELAQLLPAYMIPASWLVLDALPLTPNGKLDRKALPQPDPTGRDGSRGPRTARERLLCDILAEVLGTPAVGIDEDFFTLGGDSIRSIQLVSRARKAGLLLTTRDMFTHKTAAALARAAGGDTADPTARREDEGGTGPYELTPIAAQLHQDTGSLDGLVASYGQYVVVRVPAGLDADLLDTALHALADHHDALRTRATEPSPGLWHLEVPAPGA